MDVAQETTIASPGSRTASPSQVEEEATRETADVAGDGLLGASLSAQPSNPLTDEVEDLFGGPDLFSSSVPAFTPLVGVGMTMKSSAL